MSVVNVLPAKIIDSIDLSQAQSAVDIAAQDEREAYAYFREAIDSIKIIMQTYTCVCATSFGKDSTVIMLASIQALIELIDEGRVPADHPLVFTNINTLVENHLIQMLSYYEQDRIAKYAKEKGLNIDMRVGKPPIAKQWASLFLSGLKIISTARVNNDCSEIMKIDNSAVIEKSVVEDYGDQVVTLLGSRVDESVSRSSSLKKRGHDTLTAEMLIEQYTENQKERVFAPIVHMTDVHVWTILRRAGTDPLLKSYAGLPPIPSYAKNHRLLHIIYSDSQDGSCPTSAKRIKGSAQSAGGCGKSARTGCYLCAKSTLDKSGEAQAKQLRHHVISGNIIKVRNYIMWVAQNNEHRTFHSRAVDETTGAVALQPNVLNAKTIDKLMWLLCQATHDDKIRAEAFRTLVDAGREMEDAGYKDIFDDKFMSTEDKAEFSYVYKKYATKHLIQPMSAETALFLSMVHSRDGVRLPPFRALYVWNKTLDGKRVEYPIVDPKQAIIDDVPDAIMIIPSDAARYLVPKHNEDHLTLKDRGGYQWKEIPFSANVPFKLAKYYLSPRELEENRHLKGSDKVNVPFTEIATLTHKIRNTPMKIERSIESSAARITKRKKVKGQSFIAERGRTSVGCASFGERKLSPKFERGTLSSIDTLLPTNKHHHWVMDYSDVNVVGGYSIDQAHVADWISIDGPEHALQFHDDFVADCEKRGKTIYEYGGATPFNTMLRHGFFKLSQSLKRHAARIIKRTAYFDALGLLSFNDTQLRELAENSAEGNFLDNIISITIPHTIENIYTMSEYRKYKAGFLLNTVRAERNWRRVATRNLRNDFYSGVSEGIKSQISGVLINWKKQYIKSCQEFALALALSQEMETFDEINIPRQLILNKGFINHLESIFASSDGWYSLLDKPALEYIKSSEIDRMYITEYALDLLAELQDIKLKILKIVYRDIKNKTGDSRLHLWFANEILPVRAQACIVLSLEIEILKSNITQEKERRNCTTLSNSFSINDIVVQEGKMEW